MGAILIPYALKGDALVHVDSVSRGIGCGCTCPNCGKPVQAKQGEIRVHHFSHVGKVDCPPALALKKVAIRLLADRVQNALVNGDEIPFSWDCHQCGGAHDGNLLRQASTIELVQGQPYDIALLGKDGAIVAGIKIAVPQNRKIDRTTSDTIELPMGIFIEINVNDENDLTKLTAPVIAFNYVGYCREQTNSKCSLCGGMMFKKSLAVIEIQCWKCKNPMKLAALNVCGHWYGAETFSNGDIAVACSRDAVISPQYSNTVKNRYSACCCPSCNSFSGQFFFHNYVAQLCRVSGTQVNGAFCVECEKSFDL